MDAQTKENTDAKAGEANGGWPHALPVAIPHFFDEKGRFLTLAGMEKKHIEVALQRFPNRSEAARRLGIGRSTLYRKLEEYGL